MQDNQSIQFLQNRVAYVRDEAAYQKLFYHFHPRLHSFCNKLIHNPEAADEIVSDVMLKLWLMGDKLAYVHDLKLYVFKAVKNACFTHLSQKKNIVHTIDEEENSIPAGISQMPEVHLLSGEAGRELELAVSTLPPQCQMVFRLIREEGLSHRQVSQVLEISQNTIETHMRLALQRIKKQLEKYLQGKK